MTLSVSVRVSSTKSLSHSFRLYFSVALLPERTARTRRNVIILLDSSGSMGFEDVEPREVDESKVVGRDFVDWEDVIVKGKFPTRMKKAVDSLRRILVELNPESKVTIITFSDSAKVLCRDATPSEAMRYLSDVKPEGETALFDAILTALELTSNNTSKVIIITDGYPTDVKDPGAYKRISFPPFVEVIPIGVGQDYNALLLASLAYLTNGRYYHVNKLEEIAGILSVETTAPVAGTQVTVSAETYVPVTLVNFQGFPIRLGSLEGVAKVLGYADVRANYSGKVMELTVEYVDPVDGKRKEERRVISLVPARTTQDYLASLDSSVIAEVTYYQKLREVQELMMGGMSVEATRKLNELKDLAERTKKPELVEATKELTNAKDRKELMSEVTKRLRS
jgi:Ca-activated chloride channel family protein